MPKCFLFVSCQKRIEKSSTQFTQLKPGQDGGRERYRKEFKKTGRYLIADNFNNIGENGKKDIYHFKNISIECNKKEEEL